MIQNKHHFLILGTLITAASLAVVGCGSSDNNVEVTNPAPAATPATATQVTVNMNQMFSTTPVVVKQDTTTNVATIVVVNNLTDVHSIVADDGSFDSNDIQVGQNATITINEPGDHPFHCGIHPNDTNERGVIRVEASASPSPSASPSASPSVSPSTSPSATPTPSVSPSPTTPPTPAPTASTTITISSGASTRTSDAFGTGPINATVGSTVKVTNNDSVAHTVTAEDGSFDTGLIQPGQSATFTAPDTTGDVPFHCTVHPNMTGVLHVS